MTALGIFEASVLAEAVEMILQGRAYIGTERLNPKFMPTPPQIAMLCEEINHRRYVRSKPQLVYERPVEITDEERERRRLKVEAAKRLIGSVADALDTKSANDKRERFAEIADRARSRNASRKGDDAI